MSWRLRKLSAHKTVEPSGPTIPDWGEPGAHEPAAAIESGSPTLNCRPVFTHCAIADTVKLNEPDEVVICASIWFLLFGGVGVLCSLTGEHIMYII